jgi:AhpD family alkylhydroperoxidase
MLLLKAHDCKAASCLSFSDPFAELRTGSNIRERRKFIISVCFELNCAMISNCRISARIVMEARLKYGQLAPEGLAKMSALEHYLNKGTGLEASLLGLVRLRASLMNGCEYCVHLHTVELRKLNETAQRITGVADWRGSEAYTKRERAALAWAEAVTNIQDGHAPDAVYDEVRAQFSEMETVNLTLVITTINAWNRIAISLGAHSGHAGAKVSAEG